MGNLRVLVTGAKGFIGSHLMVGLDAKGCVVGGVDLKEPLTHAWEAIAVPVLENQPHIYNADLQKHEVAEFCVSSFRPDVVVHLAAHATMEDSYTDPVSTWGTNIMGTVHVLEACRKRKVPLIVASSDKAYGHSRPIPFTESGTPLRPKYPYDTSKACEDMIARSYARSYDMAVTVTRAANVYGPGDLHWTRLVPRSFRSLANGERPVVYLGMEGVKREWIHISDVVEAYWTLVREISVHAEETSGQAYNIGSGIVLPLTEMMDWILAASGSKGVEPLVQSKEFQELGDEYLDSRQLRKLAWEPKVDLAHGLRDTWGWYSRYLEAGGR